MLPHESFFLYQRSAAPRSPAVTEAAAAAVGITGEQRLLRLATLYRRWGGAVGVQRGVQEGLSNSTLSTTIKPLVYKASRAAHFNL